MGTTRHDSAFADCRPGQIDLTEKVNYLAKRTSLDEVELSAEGDVVCGVITEGKAAGYNSTFQRGPQGKCVAGGAIAIDDRIQSDSAGRAITGTSNSFGRAISATTAAGQIVMFEWDRE